MRILTLALLIACTVAAYAQDKVQTFAQAIAKAEGFYSKGTLPNRCHNPGDLKVRPGERYPGQTGVCRGGHVRFKNDMAGWAALDHQIEKILSGESRFYKPEMSVKDISRRYAGNWRVWAKNVSQNLAVPPTMTLAEYFEIPPVLKFKPNEHALEGVL